MFIDTHAHLYSEEFDADRMAMVQRAIDQGLGRVYLPNVDVRSIEPMRTLCQQVPDVLYPLMGLHPCSVQQDYLIQLNQIESELLNGDYYGIGEIGIDLHWDPGTLSMQEDAFRIQCGWAYGLDLPVIIHSRQALDEVIRVLEQMDPRPSRGIFHCFSGTTTQVRRIEGLGDYYFGLGGVITFKNSGLNEMINDLPLDKIVLETDAPYLAPVPHRGKRNESAYLPLVAHKLAEFKKTTIEIIENQTTINALKVYSKNK